MNSQSDAMTVHDNKHPMERSQQSTPQNPREVDYLTDEIRDLVRSLQEDVASLGARLAPFRAEIPSDDEVQGTVPSSTEFGSRLVEIIEVLRNTRRTIDYIYRSLEI